VCAMWDISCKLWGHMPWSDTSRVVGNRNISLVGIALVGITLYGTTIRDVGWRKRRYTYETVMTNDDLIFFNGTLLDTFHISTTDDLVLDSYCNFPKQNIICPI
jgi:hypothetical protein